MPQEINEEEDNKSALEELAQKVQNKIDEIEDRISELEKEREGNKNGNI
mgnify:CR=1 FL=1